ncbi:hypothetical protein ACIPPS_18790 [Streptomyces sp. NPDC090127]|uniref:hypothetical protein n=1 Tax=Streptomyces sp. NPDC090127 TaxID=3365953 RepID=UPI0038041BA4
MRKTLVTLALTAAAVLGGSGAALAHGGPEFGDNDVYVVEHGPVDVGIVVCGDFSVCVGD